MKKTSFEELYALFSKYKQPLKIMKITFLLVIIGTLGLSAKTTYSQEAKVSLDLEDITVNELLRELGQKTDFTFWYNDKVMTNNEKISLNVKDQTVDKILALALKDQNLSYKIKDKTIFIYKAEVNEGTVNAMLQKIKIRGTVVDASTGEPIPGVSITVEGTTLGTTTEEDGHYTIETPGQNSVLVFNFVGYLSERITVTDLNIIDVQLSPDITNLDEVVVVGYGTQKRYSVVGSITSIEPEKLQAGTTRSMSNNLAGQLAGIIAVQRSGEPGYDNSSFWIRGISTFAGNREPLVLIDGIERSLNNIDPAEIETFSILKDASASAVYGVRGANGVILINTKRGKVGKPKIELRFERGFTQPVQLPEFAGAAEYLEVLNSIAKESGSAIPYSDERISNIRNKVDPDLYPDVNWLDAITKDHATNSRTNLSVSGGTKLLRYSLVGSYYDENGIIERDSRNEWNSSMKLRRYNVRSNVDINVTPTTLFRVNIGGYLEDNTRPPLNIDYLFNQAFEIPPYVHPIQYSSGEFPVTPERTNPWVMATQSGYERGSASKIESLFSVEQDFKFFLPGLKAKINFAFDRYSRSGVIRSKSPDYYNPSTGRNEDGSLDLVIYRYGQDFLGYGLITEWGDKSIYLEENLSYSQNYGKHFIDAMFLYNQRNYDKGERLPFRNQGIAGRLSYSYDRRYIGELNFGYNGSENFAKGHRYGFFPSAAIGWLMSEEAFMSSLSNTFTKVKFRASYGLVGNDKIDGRRFSYITTIGGTDGYTWGVNNDYNRAGRREGDYGVVDLTWESVTKANLGMELGLWNSLELQVDIFKEKRKDIFMQRQTVPGSSGFIQTPWANYGKVDNKGIDISLDVNKKLSSDLSISARGTFTYAKNEVIEKDEASSIVGTNRSETGKPVGQIFGLIAEGLFTDEDFADINGHVLKETLPVHTYSPVSPGDIKYKDVNTDGKISDLDKTAIGGTKDPEIVYGFGLNARFKNLDFGFFFQGNAKTYRTIGGTYFIPGSGNGSLGNFYSNVDDRWTVENPSQNVFWPRLYNSNNSNNIQTSTWWLKDMSMLRLKNVELGFSFPARWINKVKMQSARVFVRGDNLLTFSSFKLWDPELDTNNGFRYPIMKSVSMGVNINF